MGRRLKLSSPRILILDIETSPILAYVWSLWDQNVGLNQIVEDWNILSWAAKWHGEREIFYMDLRNAPNKRKDVSIMSNLLSLMDHANVIVTQNGDKFDIKKIKARLLLNNMRMPSPFQTIDTKKLASRHLGLTSNSLEYMADNINTKNRKSKHKKFTGMDLWRECLAGNMDAWQEMEHYNKLDVLATEELYNKLAPLGTSVDLNVYRDSEEFLCQCGSNKLKPLFHKYTNTGKFDLYLCESCKAWISTKGAENNHLSKEKRASLRGPAL